MNNVDELKTFIILSGNKRLPDLEQEIFADDTLIRLYLLNLCKDFSWCDDTDSNVWLAFVYVRDTLQGKWPIAEPLLRTNTHWWARYQEITANDSH